MESRLMGEWMDFMGGWMAGLEDLVDAIMEEDE